MENFDFICSELTDFIINNQKQISEKYLIKYLILCSFDWSSYTELTHRHHILPRSMFPEHRSNTTNISVLPIKIHLLAHKFLNLGIKSDIRLLRSVLILEKFYGKNFDTALYKRMRTVSNKNASLRMMGKNNSVHKAIANGNHNVAQQLREGKHPGQGKNNWLYKKSLEGKHPSSLKNTWEQPTCNENTITLFYYAEEIYHLYKLESEVKYWSFTTKCNKILPEKLSVKSMPSLLRKLNSGWIPNEDDAWKSWKQPIKRDK